VNKRGGQKKEGEYPKRAQSIETYLEHTKRQVREKGEVAPQKRPGGGGKVFFQFRGRKEKKAGSGRGTKANFHVAG